MGKFRDSQTARNLMFSFAGKSQARNRYTYFARRAFEEGYFQIASIFEETAGHECERFKSCWISNAEFFHYLRFWQTHFNGLKQSIMLN